MPDLSFQPLIDLLENDGTAGSSFDEIIDHLLPEYLRTRAVLQEREIEIDQHVSMPPPFVTGAD
jgi:hypothetical protein